MSVVVDRDNGQQGSLWQAGRYEGAMSREEYMLLLHLRMLPAGIRAVRFLKTGRGMRGLREFRVCEVVRVVTSPPTPPLKKGGE